MKTKEILKNERGITLVALIITIIVLIILAAVTIISFIDSGLLKTATQGTENYANAQSYEQGVMDNLDKYANKVIANITGGNGGSGGTNPSNPTDPEKPDVPEEPEGPTMPAEWDSTKVYAYESDGTNNEFVWVPVANPSEMFGTDTNGNTIGQLYNFSASGATKRTYSSTGYHEPDYLADTTYGDASETEERGIYQLKSVVGLTGSNSEILEKWKKQLQEEFEAMKKSVEKYNGFYIGRYETGNLSQTKAVVAKNNTDIGDQNWYVQYQKSKTIANGKSSMIWGCQWDAVMKWFLSSEDEETRTYVTDSTGKGNYAGTQGDTNIAIPTGSNDAYRVNNIYDMAGNVYDWTIESFSTSRRVIRRRLLWAEQCI